MTKTSVKPNVKQSLGLKEEISDVSLMFFNYRPPLRCPQGSVCDRIEGLCILLRRLAYPCRYSDMVSRFAKPVPVLCMVSNIVLNYIFDLHHHRITTWNNSILSPFAIQQYFDTVSDKVLPLTTVLGLWMELFARFAGRGNTNGLFITGTRGYMP